MSIDAVGRSKALSAAIDILGGLALGVCISAGLVPPAQAQDSSSRQWWVCHWEVPVSSGIGVRMTLVGPAGSRNANHTIYIASFNADETPTSVAANSQGYLQEFKTFLDKSGYQTAASVSGGSASGQCSAQTSAQEAASRRSFLGANMEGRGMKVTMNPVTVAWSPAAAPTPAAGPTQGTAPIPAGANMLGVVIQDVTPEMALLFGLKDAKGGAAINDIKAGSAGEAGGLKKLDIITEISGQAVTSGPDVARIWRSLRQGYKAPLRVWRDGAYVDLLVEVLTAPQAEASLPAQTASPGVAASNPSPPTASALVADAVEKALQAEKDARAKAAEAQQIATQARQRAAEAQLAAGKARRKEPGYVSFNGKLGAKQIPYRFDGEGNIEAVKAMLGVRTYTKSGDTEAGEFLGSLQGLGLNDVKEKGPFTGTSFAGQYQGGFRNGLGVYTWPEGTTQSGEWFDDEISGLAVTLGRPGNSYAEKAGQFKANALTGYGVLIFKDGRRQEGQFASNALTGYGRELSADGVVVRQGLWAAGNLTQPAP